METPHLSRDENSLPNGKESARAALPAGRTALEAVAVPSRLIVSQGLRRPAPTYFEVRDAALVSRVRSTVGQQGGRPGSAEYIEPETLMRHDETARTVDDVRIPSETSVTPEAVSAPGPVLEGVIVDRTDRPV